MQNGIDDPDWYEVLSIPMNATEKDILRGYRKMAKIKHPDRNPNDPNAADNFALVKKARDILLDPTQRLEVDARIQARLLRKKRQREATESIRTMKEDLLAREAAALAQKTTTSSTDSLIKESLELKEKTKTKKSQIQTQSIPFIPEDPSNSFTVLLKWNQSKHNYTKEEVLIFLKPFSSISASIIKLKKGLVYLSFKYFADAETFVELLKPPSHDSEEFGVINVMLLNSTQNTLSHIHSTKSPDTEKSHAAINDDDYEEMVLAKMKAVAQSKKN